MNRRIYQLRIFVVVVILYLGREFIPDSSSLQCPEIGHPQDVGNVVNLQDVALESPNRPQTNEEVVGTLQ